MRHIKHGFLLVILLGSCGGEGQEAYRLSDPSSTHTALASVRPITARFYQNESGRYILRVLNPNSISTKIKSFTINGMQCNGSRAPIAIYSINGDEFDPDKEIEVAVGTTTISIGLDKEAFTQLREQECRRGRSRDMVGDVARKQIVLRAEFVKPVSNSVILIANFK